MGLYSVQIQKKWPASSVSLPAKEMDLQRNLSPHPPHPEYRNAEINDESNNDGCPTWRNRYVIAILTATGIQYLSSIETTIKWERWAAQIVSE